MFFSMIENRRSIRRFTDQKIDPLKKEKLIESALRAPSSRSINPLSFIVVDQPELLGKLSIAKPHGASFLKNAPLGIVVCADASKSDVWVEDASVATTFIHLAAQAIGLGSCWIQIRKREHDDQKSADSYIKEILKINDNMMVESIVAIGYPDEDKQGHPRSSLPDNRVFHNMYGGGSQ